MTLGKHGKSFTLFDFLGIILGIKLFISARKYTLTWQIAAGAPNMTQLAHNFLEGHEFLRAPHMLTL